MSYTFHAREGGPELNVANANAAIIAQAAGVGDLSAGEIPVEQIERAIPVLEDGWQLARPEERGENYISFGCSLDQMRRYAESLRALVDDCKAHGINTISVS